MIIGKWLEKGNKRDYITKALLLWQSPLINRWQKGVQLDSNTSSTKEEELPKHFRILLGLKGKD